MDETEFINLTKKNFSFLFQSYGFVVESSSHEEWSGSCNVKLRAGRVHIEIYEDKGQALMYVNSYGLSEIIGFLTQGSDQPNWSFLHQSIIQGDVSFEEWRRNYPNRIDYQMKNTSTILKPHTAEIIRFFTEGDYKVKKKELDRFIKKQWDESETGKFINQGAKTKQRGQMGRTKDDTTP
jgi:hypothetical protein